MKKVTAFLAAISIMASVGCGRKPSVGKTNGLSGKISLSGAFALYPLAVKWAEEFGKIHPDVRIDISAGGAGKGMADVLGGMVDIGMVSREVQPSEAAKGAWWVAVAKDGVVATMCDQNPLAAEIARRGLRKEQLSRLWREGAETTWEELLFAKKGSRPSAVHLYTRSDSCGAAETWAAFFGGKQEDLKGVGVYGDPGLAEAVRKDALAIGYNNINYAYDPQTLRPLAGLAVIPLDLDGDGRLSEGESFYDTRDHLVAAVSDGRYPSPPARDLYFVCKGRPQQEAVKRFLQWVLAEGQAYVTEAGYVSPAADKIAGARAKLK